jgi:glycosyltransferase involved in cell wall biosynthesis
MLPSVMLTLARIARADGGPSRTVPELASALAELGHAVQLVTCARPPAPELPTNVATSIYKYGSHLGCALAMAKMVRRRTEHNVVVHDNGLWLPQNIAMAMTARRCRVPLMVSPRGMLSPIARQYSRRRKLGAWWLYQRRLLRSASLLHATSHAEAEALAELRLGVPIAVVPVAVPLPPPVQRRRDGERLALVIARLHPIKGLPLLVDAWARVRPSGWRLCIAGPDCVGHRHQLLEQAKQLGILDNLVFPGTVVGEQKQALLEAADLFLLPSRCESFGFAVAEALAAGLPVITTTATPWGCIAESGAGWSIPADAQTLAAALAAAVSLSDPAREDMGRRARALIARDYAPQTIAVRMSLLYRWLCGLSPRPHWLEPGH